MEAEPPMLGEPLSLEFANTRYTQRGTERDGLASVPHLVAWLNRARDRLNVAMTGPDLGALGNRDLARAVDLRDALRVLFAAIHDGQPVDPGAIQTVNSATAAGPRWLEFETHGDLRAVTRRAGSPLSAVLAVLAEDAIGATTGASAAKVRACGAPGCILFFHHDHPRRTWCSPRCADRVRSARYYARHRTSASS